MQRRNPLALGLGPQLTAQLGIAPGARKKTVAQGPQVKARTTAQDHRPAPACNIRDRQVGLLSILRRRRWLVAGENPDQVVRGPLQLGLGRLSGQDGQTRTDLEGITADDLTAQQLGQTQGQRGLACGRRTDDAKDALRNHQATAAHEAAPTPLATPKAPEPPQTCPIPTIRGAYFSP